jgi:D-alanine-D-alanine ligase
MLPFQTDAALARRASDRAINVDVIFPVLHGTFGEDGTIQGLLELADIPYVGAGVLGSAAGMDKDIMKSLFMAAGIPIVKHVTILRSDWEKNPKKVQKLVGSKLKYPVFVKPANLGSSVGISKAHDRTELGPAIEEAAKFDRKIVIEQGVGGKKQKAREIECSVLGNDEPAASLPGEIVPDKEFYDYTAKYLDEGSQLIIPAKLSKAETKKVQELALRAFKAVDCSGLARVDFLMDPGSRNKTRKIYVNEINTMPGFTAISMYPKLWAASGLAYTELISRLIALGLARHADKKKNQYSR